MKFFKYTLIATLVCTTAMHAKKTGGAPSPYTPSPQPVITTPTKQFTPQPTGEASVFQSLIAHAKRDQNAWDRRQEKLNSVFVNDIIAKGRRADLNDAQLEIILKTARDMHGVFSYNQQKNISILQAVDEQIAAALQ